MTIELCDPHEIAKCACPRLDGRDCARVRSGRHLIEDHDLERHSSFDSDDECRCICHDIYEEQLRDVEDAHEFGEQDVT